MPITPPDYSRLCKLSPNCSVAVVRPANVMINIFTRTSSPSIWPNCSLSKCISTCVLRIPSPSLTPISITSIQQQHLPGVCICICISASVPGPQARCITAWCRNGRGSSSGKEKMEETRQLMVLVPSWARTINSKNVFNVFSVTHQHKHTHYLGSGPHQATATILRHI